MQDTTPSPEDKTELEQLRQTIAKIDKTLEDPNLPPETRENLLEERQDLARDYVMAKMLFG